VSAWGLPVIRDAADGQATVGTPHTAGALWILAAPRTSQGTDKRVLNSACGNSLLNQQRCATRNYVVR
jgi:hypothetical protein